VVEVAGEELEEVELASRQPEVGKKAGRLKRIKVERGLERLMEVELASRQPEVGKKAGRLKK